MFCERERNKVAKHETTLSIINAGACSLMFIHKSALYRLQLLKEEFEDTKGVIRIRISKTTQWPEEKVQ